jgi:alpha-tubulin suppressor-like RCC1 family protein
MGSANRGYVGAVLFFSAFAACAKPAEVQLDISFTDQELAASVQSIELNLLESCDGVAGGNEATNYRRRWSLTRSNDGPDFGDIGTGAHALYARGFSDTCAVVAAGCTEFKASTGETTNVALLLTGVPGDMGCAANQTCTAGVCIDGTDGGPPDADSGPIDGDACPGKPNGTACAAGDAPGRCMDDACCTGCVKDGECMEGVAKAACGLGGGECDSCDSCECGADACTEGVCVAPVAVASVNLATEHGCAVTDEGGLWCWGSDDAEKLGLGAVTAPQKCNHDRGGVVALDCFPAPRKLEAPSAGSVWSSVSLGDNSSCAIDSDGALFCWGGDSSGQAGNGGASSANVALPTRIGADTWKTVSAGSSSVCAIRSDDTLWCWGSNGDGQLGTGALDGNRTAPTQVTEALLDAANAWTAVAGSANHFCGLRGGNVYCWGNDEQSRVVYETPTDTTTDKPTPTRVTSTGDYGTVLTGAYTTCSRKSANGETSCWGNNQYATFGTPVTAPSVANPPTVVPWPATGTFDLRNSYHACGATTAGELTCWGRATYGQLGNGVDPPTTDSTATAVAALGDWKWTRVATGRNFTCAVREDGRLYCWGRAQAGQLGRADLTLPAAPGTAGDLTFHNATPGRVCFEE